MPVGGTVGYELFDRGEPLHHQRLPGQRQPAARGRGRAGADHRHPARRPRRAGPHRRSPSASCSAASEVKPTRLDRPRACAGRRRSTSGRSRASASWSRPRCRAWQPDARHPRRRCAATCWPAPTAPDADRLRVRRRRGLPRSRYEDRLRGKIVQLLERTVGAGKVDAAVSADLDFDEVATTAETYDPQSQVVRSTQTTDEATDQQETQAAATGRRRQQSADRAAARRMPAAGQQREDATGPRRRSTTRSRARSATRPSAAPRCAGCRSRCRSTASTATQPDGTTSLRAARRRGAGAAGGAGAQRGRRRREPRRRGRGREPAVRRRALPAEPPSRGWLGRAMRRRAWPRLARARRASACSPCLVLFFGVRPALRRLLAAVQPATAPSGTAGGPGCRRQAAARARRHRRHDRRRPRRQSGRRPRAGRGRGSTARRARAAQRRPRAASWST